MSETVPRVLVIEDDASVRDGVTTSLRSEGFEVRAVENGEDVSDMLDGFRPDIAIVDVRLPEGPDGYAIAREIRSRSDVPVLFLTAADKVSDRLEGFEAGADDYVVKPFAMSELLARVRALLRRSGRPAAAIWEVADLVVDERLRVARRGTRDLDLTPTEFDVLAVFVRNVGQPLSKTRILSHVWDFDAYDTNLVEVHVSALRRKLEALGPRLIHTVRGTGYVLRA